MTAEALAWARSECAALAREMQDDADRCPEMTPRIALRDGANRVRDIARALDLAARPSPAGTDTTRDDEK
jgi:hypothetical protein